MHSRQSLECIDYNFLTQVIEKLLRRGVLLDLTLTNKEELARDVKAGDSLGYSHHKMLEFRILSRIILKQERRKQKEFFEKKKLKSKMKLLGVSSSPKSSAVSLDLLNLYVVNQISTKKDNAESVKKPVHIDMTGGIKIPLRRHNIELPMSPPRTQYHPSNLDDIQNRLQKRVLDSRRQHLSEKVKYQHNAGNTSDQDPWISKTPSQCIFRKSDTVLQELFNPLNRPDYLNSASPNPVMMTSKESESSERINEPIFGVVKETAELIPTQDEHDCSFLAMFEDDSQPVHNNLSSHFNPFVNQSSTANFFIDPDDRNQMTNRSFTYDTREVHPAVSAKRCSVDRHLKGIFTAPEQVLFKSNSTSSASYKEPPKTYLQDNHKRQYYFIPSENKEKPAKLEQNVLEAFTHHHGQQINLKENAQNHSRKKSDSSNVKESAWRQDQLFGFEEFETAQEKECKFGVSSNLHEMEKG
ncbi:regulator of DNA class I crossover intermediates 1 [Struthio camelus]|uniref:regulator of DNA class I crossover intermediates 1 n=1 Tax=Struthio camelus TaxID=8801 RepID=UPI003603E52D